MTRIAQSVMVALMIAGVLLISVAPQSHLAGSYQATHGPTTALRSLRFLRSVVASIAAAASVVVAFCFLLHDSPRTESSSPLGSVLLC